MMKFLRNKLFRKMAVFNTFSSVISIISFEIILTWCKWPNGGTAIFFRSVLVSLEVFFLYIGILHLTDSSRILEFNFSEFVLAIHSNLKIFGAIYTGVYIALYSRFAQQWTYLADLYNKIKNAESRSGCSEEVINVWKAGFIEDAIALHLARKKIIASIINNWYSDQRVKDAFDATVHIDADKINLLMDDINFMLKERVLE